MTKRSKVIRADVDFAKLVNAVGKKTGKSQVDVTKIFCKKLKRGFSLTIDDIF